MPFTKWLPEPRDSSRRRDPEACPRLGRSSPLPQPTKFSDVIEFWGGTVAPVLYLKEPASVVLHHPNIALAGRHRQSAILPVRRRDHPIQRDASVALQ